MVLDPNLSRVIEETIGVVSDVESRLQALKIGITQALPQLAPALLAREQALAARGMPYGAGFPALPPNLHPAYGMQAGYPPIGLSAFGALGVTSPFGFGSPFRRY